MTDEKLEQVGRDADLIVGLRYWIYGIGIAAAAVAITVYRFIGEV